MRLVNNKVLHYFFPPSALQHKDKSTFVNHHLMKRLELKEPFHHP